MELTIREDTNNLIKVHEVINLTQYYTVGRWYKYNREECYEDHVIEDDTVKVNMNYYKSYFNSEFDINGDEIKDFYDEYQEGIDYAVTVTRTNEDDESETYKLEFWMSDLFAKEYDELDKENF